MPEIIVHDNTQYMRDQGDTFFVEKQNARLYSVFVKDANGQFILKPNDPTAVVTFTVDGVETLQSQLNSNALWDISKGISDPQQVPGILFRYVFPKEDSVLLISSQGVETTINI